MRVVGSLALLLGAKVVTIQVCSARCPWATGGFPTLSLSRLYVHRSTYWNCLLECRRPPYLMLTYSQGAHHGDPSAVVLSMRGVPPLEYLHSGKSTPREPGASLVSNFSSGNSTPDFISWFGSSGPRVMAWPSPGPLPQKNPDNRGKNKSRVFQFFSHQFFNCRKV